MAFRKRGAASPDAHRADAADSPAEDPVDVSAEEAEALAAAAEADAAAARARANLLKVQQQAKVKQATVAEPVIVDTDPAVDDVVVVADSDVADSDEAVTDEPVSEEPVAEDAVGIEAVEADDGGDADVEADFEAEDTSRRGGRGATIAKFAAAFLAVIAIAALASTSAWIVVKHRQAEHQRDLSAQFAAAARQGVVSLMSLDFNRAQEDVQRIVDNSTGQFREDFQSQAEEFAKVAESSKVVTAANVTATAVQTMTEDTADVLVAAASTITNAQGAKEDPRSWRLIVSVARDGDQIKMAKVEFAP